MDTCLSLHAHWYLTLQWIQYIWLTSLIWFSTEEGDLILCLSYKCTNFTIDCHEFGTTWMVNMSIYRCFEYSKCRHHDQKLIIDTQKNWHKFYAKIDNSCSYDVAATCMAIKGARITIEVCLTWARIVHRHMHLSAINQDSEFEYLFTYWNYFEEYTPLSHV